MDSTLAGSNADVIKGNRTFATPRTNYSGIVAEIEREARAKQRDDADRAAMLDRQKCVEDNGFVKGDKVRRQADGKRFVIVEITRVYCLRLLPLAADGQVIKAKNLMSCSPEVFERIS